MSCCPKTIMACIILTPLLTSGQWLNSVNEKTILPFFCPRRSNLVIWRTNPTCYHKQTKTCVQKLKTKQWFSLSKDLNFRNPKLLFVDLKSLNHGKKVSLHILFVFPFGFSLLKKMFEWGQNLTPTTTRHNPKNI